MNKIAVVVDSTGCLSPEVTKELNIFTSYITILFGTDAYQEFKEVTPEMFIQKSSEMKDLPSTSQPSPGQMMELYDEIFGQGYDEIIHVALASALSGTYQNAVNVAADYNGKVHVFDSHHVAFAQGSMAIQAAELVRAGKTVEEILVKLEEIRENSGLIAAISELTNLIKGGRLSNAQGALGKMLSIKPIIASQPSGKVEAVDKVRTFKKALKAIVSHAQEQKLTADYAVKILHMENLKDAELVAQEIREIYPDIEVQVGPLSLVLAVHAGSGAVAVSWGKKA